MKTKILFLSALIIGFKAASAQSNLSFGISAGGNLATFAGDLVDASNKGGFNGGAFIIWGPWEHWGFSAGLFYSLEGAKYKSTAVPELTFENTASLSYIKIPVTVNYFFNSYKSNFRPKLFAGPVVGILAGGSIESKVTSTIDNTITTSTYKSNDAFDSFDLGLKGGAGFNYRLTDKGIWLNVDAAYYHSMLDIAKDNHADESIYNRVIFLNVGLTIPIGYANPE